MTRPRGRPRKATADMVAIILAAYRVGISPRRIAEAFGMSTTCALATIRRAGEPRRPKGRPRRVA